MCQVSAFVTQAKHQDFMKYEPSALFLTKTRIKRIFGTFCRGFKYFQIEKIFRIQFCSSSLHSFLNCNVLDFFCNSFLFCYSFFCLYSVTVFISLASSTLKIAQHGRMWQRAYQYFPWAWLEMCKSCIHCSLFLLSPSFNKFPFFQF